MKILFDYGAGGELEWSPPTFKQCAAADIHAVFLNEDEFAEKRDVRFDGKVYRDVLIVVEENALQGKQEKNYTMTRKDNSEGLYKRVMTVYLALEDIGGKQPESGAVFEMNDQAGESYFRFLYVLESKTEDGMLKLLLSGTDE